MIHAEKERNFIANIVVGPLDKIAVLLLDSIFAWKKPSAKFWPFSKYDDLSLLKVKWTQNFQELITV